MLPGTSLYLRSSAPKKIPISSLSVWLSAMTVWMVVVHDEKPHLLRDLIAYIRQIATLAGQRGFEFASTYDVSNRAYCASTHAPLSSLKAHLYTELLVAAPPPVLSSTPTSSPSSPASESRERRSTRPPPRAPQHFEGKEICRKFNDGRCPSTPCPTGRAHACETPSCRSLAHGLVDCKTKVAAPAPGPSLKRHRA